MRFKTLIWGGGIFALVGGCLALRTLIHARHASRKTRDAANGRLPKPRIEQTLSGPRFQRR